VLFCCVCSCCFGRRQQEQAQQNRTRNRKTRTVKEQQSPQILPEAKKTVPDPRMMPSVEQHQDIPTEDVAVMPVGEPRKRRRIHKLAAERRQKIKDKTRGNHEFKRKSPAACRMVSRRAAVARRKGNTFRRLQSRENCGSRRKFASARRGMTQRAEVARRREQGHKTYDQDCVAPGFPEGRTSRIKRWKGPECSKGSRDRGLRQQLRLRKTTTTGNGIRGRSRRQELCPRSQKILYETLGQTFKLEVMKRAVVTSVRRRKTSVRTLWRGRPPPKWKKSCKQNASR
jgi:hypothetical protein